MKKLLVLTAAVFAATAGAAAADELSFLGKAEYAFEAETFETKLGAQYDIDNWSFAGLAVIEDTSTTDLEFRGLELTGAYAVNANIDVYAIVELDEDLDYTETTIGTAFKF